MITFGNVGHKSFFVFFKIGNLGQGELDEGGQKVQISS